MKRARIILNWPCGRHCRLCCNRYDTIMATAEAIRDFEPFRDFDEVMLTGGDPLLMPSPVVAAIVGDLRGLGVKRVFLYTTFWSAAGPALLPLIDGVHFSIHDDHSPEDFLALARLERDALANPTKSFRLFVDVSVTEPVQINVQAWSRVERKKFMTEEELLVLQPGGLPTSERLYVYLPTAGRPGLKRLRVLSA